MAIDNNYTSASGRQNLATSGDSLAIQLGDVVALEVVSPGGSLAGQAVQVADLATLVAVDLGTSGRQELMTGAPDDALAFQLLSTATSVNPDPGGPVWQAAQVAEVTGLFTAEWRGPVGPVGPLGPVGDVGPVGPQGIPGDVLLGGVECIFTGLTNGDLLMFNGSAWGNENKVHVSDGGNF